MAKILRWHISRLYPMGGQERGMPKDRSRRVDVTITPEAGKILEKAGAGEPLGLADVKSDNIEWWESNEEQELEGWTAEDKLISVFVEKSVRLDTESRKKMQQERELEEDMVFLQFVENESVFNKSFQKLKKDKTLPNVTELLEIDKVALWLDFTTQARRMAAAFYRRALGEKEEGDDNAS